FDGGDAGDLGGQFGGHRGRYGHGRGGAHSGSDRRGGVGGTRDEFVGELLGPEPGELGAQRLEVAYGHAGGHLDDAVREVRQSGTRACSALAGSLPGSVAEGRGPSGGHGCGDLLGSREVTLVSGVLERGPSGTGRASLVVTRVVLRAALRPLVRSPCEESALPGRGRASHGRPSPSRSRGTSAGRSSPGPAGC